MATDMVKIAKENATHNMIARGISEIRIAKVKQHIASYESGNITAQEFLQLTDNLLQDELKQAVGLI